MQAGALAEFRANMNYETALRTYQTAYQELARIQPPGPSALQRFAELAAVAEQIHLKVAASRSLHCRCQQDHSCLVSPVPVCQRVQACFMLCLIPAVCQQ